MVTKQKLKQLINQLFLLVEAVKDDDRKAIALSKAMLRNYDLPHHQRGLLVSFLSDNWNQEKAHKDYYDSLCSNIIQNTRLCIENNYSQRPPTKEDTYTEALESLECNKESIATAIANLLEAGGYLSTTTTDKESKND